MNNKLPNWLEQPDLFLKQMHGRDQTPHALLIHGPAGVGRRIIGFTQAARLLGNPSGLRPGWPVEPGLIDTDQWQAHPDLRLVQPEKEQGSIGVDAIRELKEFFALSSHQSGAKVALITPADAMTNNAANALLKTLEEPPPGSYLMMVVDALSRLPATIVSRCQRLRIPLPDQARSLAWLAEQDAAVDWSPVLEMTGGSPLLALHLEKQSLRELADKLESDFSALVSGGATPADIVKRWSRHDPDFYWRWLYRRVGNQLRQQICSDADSSLNNAVNARLQNRDETLNMQAGFNQLREIGVLRQMQGSGLSAELQLTGVLSHWYDRAP